MPEQVEPVLDVARVAQFADDAEVRAEERGGELSHQFLGGIGAGAEARRQVAIEARLEVLTNDRYADIGINRIMPRSGLCRVRDGRPGGYA